MQAHLGKLGALALLVLALPLPVLTQDATAQQDDLVVQVPDGYQIEKVVDGLTYPTALTWDGEGQMYVAEAGGAFLDLGAPARILSVDVEDGETEEVVNLNDVGLAASVHGIFWHDGAFYVTHRDAGDRTGAVSRVTPESEVMPIFRGIVDSQSEHQVNDIRMGADGRMYVTSGPAGNAAVMGFDFRTCLLKEVTDQVREMGKSSRVNFPQVVHVGITELSDHRFAADERRVADDVICCRPRRFPRVVRVAPVEQGVLEPDRLQ